MVVFQYITGLNDGGAETLVKDYVLKMRDDGFYVKVIVPFLVPNTANYKQLKDKGIDIVPLYRKRNLMNRILHRFVPELVTSKLLLKAIREYQPSVIHVHLSLLKTIAPIRFHLKEIKLFYTCHNEPNRFLGKLNTKEHDAAVKLIKSNDLHIIALHDDMRREINAMFHIDNTIVVNNGVDFRRFQNINETKISIRRSLGVPEKALVLGHIGRFSKQKNHHFLVNVFKEVYERNKESFLLLVGSGPLEYDVKERLAHLGISERTLVLSHRTDIPRLLKAMDVFVFPSFFEGLSIALIEAQVSGLRCLISTKVNKSSFLTEKAVPMDISATPELWAEEILTPNKIGVPNQRIDEYDINVIVRQMEIKYMG